VHEKLIVITGASSGIGAAAARRFSQAGYPLFVAVDEIPTHTMGANMRGKHFRPRHLFYCGSKDHVHDLHISDYTS
jgi:NAD(P)-dependent dehydrogenase (short-subunit alcohol dehydrogenase family)